MPAVEVHIQLNSGKHELNYSMAAGGSSRCCVAFVHARGSACSHMPSCTAVTMQKVSRPRTPSLPPICSPAAQVQSCVS